ncbi:M16 family metallopeptidase [Flaviaesturariibacter aridisoli]|uniref:Insulinase family protein n=1 Tax=Flaviaesturariibacter aridisoli TaxID=2545761 RepID=A0A4V6P660_9BACT|nr:pitrilysin family protein [Flaviaesturariibacter aridisoli]TCZ68831.1 insulinase family protein [Flaviaesturariibacter aridisoli]
MIKRNVLVLAGSMLLFAGAVRAQAKLVEKVTKTGSELVIPYEKYVLPNGLTVLVHEDHSDPVVHVDVTYHVGSAREEIGKSGFAHFFEHMMFQGSDHVADEQHFKLVQAAGGTLNGTTNQDRTNYFETVPSNQLEKMLWLESDRMGFLLDAVTQKKFEVQRSTVKNERGQNYDNRPYGLANETISRNLYPYGHPYSWMTIGYLEDLNRSNADDLKNFFLRWYGPNNATVSVGGDVKPAEVVKLVEKYFGSIPRGPEVTPVKVPAVVVDKDRYVSMVDNYARLPRFYYSLPTVPNYHPDMVALDCLAEILGQGKNSVLYQTAVKKQLALQATAFHSNSELAGEFEFDLVPAPGKSLADMEKLVRAAFDSFEVRGVTDEDITKFKGAQESQMINGLQSVSGKVSRLASYQTFTGNPNKIGEELSEIRKLTKEDVLRVYRQYIKGKGAVILSVVPKGQEQLVAAEPNYKIDSSNYSKPDYGYAGLKYNKAKDNFDRAKIPAAGPAPVVKVPAFWKKDAPNGLRIIGTENSEVPTVVVSLFIPGGHLTAANDLSKAGTASLFAAMMNEDTKDHSAEQISQELSKLGASLNVSSGLNGITFTVQTLKKNLDPVLTLLQERLFRPNFTEAAFNRIKNQRLQAFKQMKSQPAAIADAVFAKVNYGPNHVLGISQNGTEETVKNIELKDVENYYNNYITSQGARLVVVGDIKQAEAEAKMGFLKNLPNKKVTLAPVPPAQPVAKTQVYLVDVPKGAQTEFRVGYATGMKWDATGDYYRSVLANYALGGNFNSRLNLNLREDKGWTYGANSSFTGSQVGGEFRFAAGIRADATDSALFEIMKDVNKYVAEGPNAEEVAFMKDAIGQFDALRYETPAQKAQFISRVLEYNLPGNYTEQQNKILKTISREDLSKVAKKMIQPEKLNVLLVGDKAKVLEKVKKLGYEVVELDADGKRVGEKKEF